MIIENNPKELEAMKEFHQGNRQEGLRLQESTVYKGLHRVTV